MFLVAAHFSSPLFFPRMCLRQLWVVAAAAPEIASPPVFVIILVQATTGSHHVGAIDISIPRFLEPKHLSRWRVMRLLAKKRRGARGQALIPEVRYFFGSLQAQYCPLSNQDADLYRFWPSAIGSVHQSGPLGYIIQQHRRQGPDSTKTRPSRSVKAHLAARVAERKRPEIRHTRHNVRAHPR